MVVDRVVQGLATILLALMRVIILGVETVAQGRGKLIPEEVGSSGDRGRSPEGGGSRSGGGGGIAQPPVRFPSLSQEYNDEESEAVKLFGEELGAKLAIDWAEAQEKDASASKAIEYISGGVGFRGVKEEDMPDGVDVGEVKRLVSQGTLLMLPDLGNSRLFTRKLLVRRDSNPPADRPNRNESGAV